MNYILLQKFADINKLPLKHVIDDNIEFQCYQPSFNHDLPYEIMASYLDSKYPICYVVTANSALCGFIKIQPDNGFLFVGPAFTESVNQFNISNYAKDFNIGPKQEKELMNALSEAPAMTIHAFADSLHFLNAYINPKLQEEPIHLSYKAPVVTKEYSVVSVYEFNSDYEKTSSIILSCIKNGDTERFTEFFSNNLTDNGISNENIPTLASNSLRAAKNTFIFACSQVSLAAVQGGLSQEVASRLVNEYIMHIESINDLNQISQMIFNMMLEFCTLVQKSQIPESDSPTINKIYRFIHNHINEKITLSDIALGIYMDADYISHYFKKKTNKTITQYIHERKIEQAKHLLSDGSFSISEISEHLGYSSQQKFQTWFKRITGQTPMQYTANPNNKQT